MSIIFIYEPVWFIDLESTNEWGNPSLVLIKAENIQGEIQHNVKIENYYRRILSEQSCESRESKY